MTEGSEGDDWPSGRRRAEKGLPDSLSESTVTLRRDRRLRRLRVGVMGVSIEVDVYEWTGRTSWDLRPGAGPPGVIHLEAWEGVITNYLK